MGDAPRLVTEPEAVERRGKETAGENVGFRAWVKYRCKLPDEELDALARAAADEVWARVDCLACGGCCRTLSITLDASDIARLARRLGVSVPAFSRRYVRDADGERSFAARPCPFLDGNACTVYEDRPQACRDFPYLHAPGVRSRLLVLIEYSLLCPVILNTLERLRRRLPWRKKKVKG